MARQLRTPRGFDVAIKHIRAVNSVAQYGSFTAAAADLGITQSAVSRLVLQLERQLGVSLFLRSTRNVVLTAPGREFTALMCLIETSNPLRPFRNNLAIIHSVFALIRQIGK